MSKKMKTYTVLASPKIWLELKIEATSATDAYDKLQDGWHDAEILESSGVKIESWHEVMGPSAWDTKGEKPKQLSAYHSKKLTTTHSWSPTREQWDSASAKLLNDPGLEDQLEQKINEFWNNRDTRNN
tara:strand:- start:1871 stop:2254 length:384 start_codon:yes stop_codon:yes gene_type:complete